MATGILNLPYSMSPVSPFDVITSQAENERIANIESLADGTGIGDNAITASKLDFATFISPDSAGWKVTTLPSGKKQYSRVVVGSDVSIGGGATGAAQTVAPPTGISGTDILSGSYLIASTYTSNAAGWDRMIGKTSISSSTISLSVYNSTTGSLNTGNQARWFLEITRI